MALLLNYLFIHIGTIIIDHITYTIIIIKYVPSFELCVFD